MSPVRALGNYVWSFWDFAHAKTFNGTFYEPGSTASTTYDLTMLDNGGTPISFPTVRTTGFQVDYSICFQDDNCAENGGCAPSAAELNRRGRSGPAHPRSSRAPSPALFF